MSVQALHIVSKHTSYDRDFFFMHKFKMMTSPNVFFFFLRFWLCGLLGGGD